MERFLNDCIDKDDELELVKKEEVLEELPIPEANHENMKVIINNDLQNGNQIEE